MKRELLTKRKFGGLTYTLHSAVHRKQHAKEVADKLRKKGRKARVVRGSAGGWVVFVR